MDEDALRSESDDRFADLQLLAAIARDAEMPAVVEQADLLAERLSAGRFFVACVGQFKRGKSTVLNALVDERVLPVGVTPVTSAVTILRHGSNRRATVAFADGHTERTEVQDVALYVAEEHNHENERGVTAVEVFLPAPILAAGLCLVDTPGIGSTFAGNTEATKAFVPHIDAALVVLGADPPISGEEMALVLEVLKQVPQSIFVLNKADRLSHADVQQAREFTERLVSARLGRAIGPVLEISAAERIERQEPTRDWTRLEAALSALTIDAADILQRSHDRGVARLTKQLRDDVDERRGALVRPLQESETRIEVLRRSVADAEIMLRELGVLLVAEQRHLLKTFQDRQAAFVEPELHSARDELYRWIDALPSGHLRDRAKAFEEASEIPRRRVEQWLSQIEPEADALYRNATQRFTSLANQFLARLSESQDPAFAGLPRSLDPEPGLREQRHFYGTSLMHLTAPGVINRVADLLLPRGARLQRIKRDAGEYLERLLRSNTTRVVFDLEQRVEVSRKKLESELRFLLQEITASAERALERARIHQQAGHEAVANELAKLDALRQRLDLVAGHAPIE
jgi:prepilin-type processing-associated H-X9-DG protein